MWDGNALHICSDVASAVGVVLVFNVRCGRDDYLGW
jgi:hypothetical protein